MSDDEPTAPPPVVAVSPQDQSPDRTQSDADNTTAVSERAANRTQSDTDNTQAAAERAANRAQADADQALNTGKLDELIEASRGVVNVNGELAIAMVEYQERAKTARRRFRATMLTLTVIIAMLLAGIYSLLNTAQHSRNQLADCIKPSGKCYQQQQQKTGQVLGDVQKIIVLAASCAPNYVTLALPARTAAIEQCIERGLK